MSNRPRGWTTRKSEKSTRPPRIYHEIRRWDGISGTNAYWDNLRRDPELWYGDGNCYVYLYGQGQSRRGPSLKVPFSDVVKSTCRQFINKFIYSDDTHSITDVTRIKLGRPSRSSVVSTQGLVELFIPAPNYGGKSESLSHHLATRNFFAFLMGRPLVGEHLGTALIALMHTMSEYRSESADNVQEMLRYLNEQGYLVLGDRPSHALAVLRMAEIFQLKDLYINAFAHCCGMSDVLFLGPEYQLLSSATRRLIHSARNQMDTRLSQCGGLLKTFLQDELAEAHLGLHAGARAHLERFRTFVHGYYAARLGYYPPPSIDPRTTIFAFNIYRTMKKDFEALYQLLVDENFDVSVNSPFLAHGGICTLQSVQAFDERQQFPTLSKPLSLLPNTPQDSSSSRRISWLGRPNKQIQNQRLATHAALLRAANLNKSELLKNGLVRAYMRFEKDMVLSPTKADKLENLSPVDARKVRWILIYAIYQTLRQATEAPPEVKDATSVPYAMCLSTADLPPWEDDGSADVLARDGTNLVGCSTSLQALGCAIEIEPDINHLAPTPCKSFTADRADKRPKRTKSAEAFNRKILRKANVRQSFAMFWQHPDNGSRGSPRKLSSNEIAVDGYGNGTNSVSLTCAQVAMSTSEIMTTTTSSISLSISDNSSSSTSLSSSSERNSSSRTSNTSIIETTPSTSVSSRRGILSDSVNVNHNMPRRVAPTAQDYINAVNEINESMNNTNYGSREEKDDFQHEWEQYTDLGGLLEIDLSSVAMVNNNRSRSQLRSRRSKSRRTSAPSPRSSPSGFR